MKKCLSIFLVFFSVFAFGKSLWDNGVSMYKISVKAGDIIKIRFSDKTIMKYRIEARKNNFETTKGKKGGGDIFSFFPNAEVNENDNTRNQNNITVNNENNFTIPAKVTAVNNELVSILGANSSLINGEIFRIEFGGECNINSLSADNSIYSTEIYGLDFKIFSESPSNTAFFNENDLAFNTNYTEISTNQVLGTNNITNTEIVTNFSAIKLEFKGIQDNKKKGIIVNYLNFIINSLFR
jgi:hypothetical protein